MISFESDYNNGAHPEVLRHFLETNDTHTICRFVTSWTTTDEDLETLKKILD